MLRMSEKNLCGAALSRQSTEELLAAPHRPHFLAHHINKRIADARGFPEFARQTVLLEPIPEQARGLVVGVLSCCLLFYFWRFYVILRVVFPCILFETLCRRACRHDAMGCEKHNRENRFVFGAPPQKAFYIKAARTRRSSATKLEHAVCARRYDAGFTKNVRLVPGPGMRKSACFFLFPSLLQSAVCICSYSCKHVLLEGNPSSSK